jgi:hypothetical protein
LSQVNQAERSLGLAARQPGGVKNSRQGFVPRQFALFRRNSAGHRFQLLAAGQFVLDHDELLLQFG